LEIDLIKNQCVEVVKLVEPIAKYYRENFPNISDFEKRVIFSENLIISEFVRLASYIYVNDFEQSTPTLNCFVDTLNTMESYDKKKLLSEIEIFVKSKPEGLEIEKMEAPMILRIVNFYDQAHLTNNVFILANYLFQVVNLILKHDNQITEIEKRILTRYQIILHESNSKGDYLNLNSVFNDFFGEVSSSKKPISLESKSQDEKPATGNIQESSKEEVYDLDTLLKELNDLIGLTSVKDEITNLVNVLKVEKIRKENNLPVPIRSLHMVFTGNPGTGKTTIGRLISKIFKALGILEKGHLIETDRSGLVAGYVGQTAAKTIEICKKSLGGVLFIDEAYALAEGGENDFGKEAINSLLKFMEDNRGNFLVIVAGYTDNMKEFIDKNPGLQSRFNKYITFDDYTPAELLLIFTSLTEKSKLKLTEPAIEKLKHILQENYNKRDKKFGNGRFARNLFEKIYANQANRIVSLTNINVESLCTITEVDI
jgi:SpoVK/Ycf46/Vps4 family AAA+-type ATPase